ncbi:aliphatic sulfonate ABC transporter substrate-binding protein [Trichocoleus sp. FACHB-262]|uniref:aliphatic sulfonate ABC transporter substrate-binding protein n=1 Tax=Trichocoleus sp. FACHB-262 TaxID=2692869 RepID=UPI001682C07F|nr:aliphatic sulfonate ABC transporter substrate-binding protein [Trichocoleus sp. FACHB-262]MBD2123548.1 aliphatic sulfonate ABC transporter substrate-binding protein [Trichocoleus sp. FACHB-262]
MNSHIRIRRRRFLQVAVPGMLSLSTTLALGSCSKSAQNTATSSTNPSDIKTKVLRMGYQQAGDLVRVTGVLEKRLEPLGIKVEWAQFAQGPQLMEAMNVGKVDVGSVGETPPIFAQAAGADIVYVVGSKRTPETGRSSIIAVPPESPIQKLEDIKGQEVVFQKASASHYFVLRALQEVGLKINDIKIRSMPNVDARGAFIEGRIPVWVSGDPHYALAEKLGRIRVIKTAEGLDSPGGYYISGRKFAEENPGLLKIVIEEIDTIEQWATNHRSEAAKLIAPEQKLSLDVAERVVGRRTFGRRAVSPALIQDQQRVADLFYENDLLPKPVNISAALLSSALYAAITPTTISQR